MIKLNITKESLNEAIQARYTEDSEVSDILLKTDKDVEEFILSAIDNYLYPQNNGANERAAFTLGQKYSK